MKKIIVIFTMIFFEIIFSDSISAISFKVSENTYAYQENENIIINNNNIKLDEIENAMLLDVSEKYVLFNFNNYIKLYYIENKEIINIDDGYNALILEDILIYETDNNNNLKCRNIIDSNIKNCIKLYSYDIKNKIKTYLDIAGNDIYLNDANDDVVVYNSIHIADNYCNDICSFVGKYNLKDASYTIIDMYNDINLDMSGNGFIENNTLIFESFFNDGICPSTKIIKQNLKTHEIELLNNDLCEFKNIEILDFDGEYILFSNNEKYIYSLEDNKYDLIDINFNEIYLYKNEILYLDDNALFYKKIDNEAPDINDSKVYEIILNNISNIKEKLEINDNLFSGENISLKLLNDIINEGIHNVRVLVCDKLNNCKEYMLMINAILEDKEAPKIYCDKVIYLKYKEKFNIDDYAYAIDNIDEEIELFVNKDVSKLKKGTHNLKLTSIDKSGNLSYKDIVIKIYSDDLIYMWYYLCLVILIIMVIIIYIYRFKKKIIF